MKDDFIGWLIVVIFLFISFYTGHTLGRRFGKNQEYISFNKPQIVIINQTQEITFYDKTVWYVDYLIDGYPQGVTLYCESDIAPFIEALSEAGKVRYLHE